MAEIKVDGKEHHIEDGEPIKDVAEEAGIVFGCKNGICGTCKVDIVSGEENLSELSQEEIDMKDRTRTKRLACQAKINSGTVEIIQE